VAVPDQPIDELDQAIMRELEADGRRAFRDIARQLNVSEATVRGRVRRLEESGVLRIIAFADPLRLGHSGLALLFLRVASGHHDAVVAALQERPEVSYISTLLGTSDLLAQVVTRDQRELGAFVRDHVRALPGVIETETIIETEVHKLRFTTLPEPAGDREGSRVTPLRSPRRAGTG
jgi:Lrp/AsnC family transcriptional regulator, regulator for asnA, asnC and gidA